jgi:hypothetical protein
MLYLDHAIIFAADLDRAAASYRRLGFGLTPRGGHPSLGTANHTIMFERDYLELLTVTVPGPGNLQWAAAMARGDGLGGMAFGTKDARATRAGLVARGIGVPEVVDFARPVEIDGRQVSARFSVAHLPTGESPAMPAFFCQQHTPEYVWLPAFQRHPNTAFAVAGLTVVAANPDALAPTYERLLGRAAVHPHPGGLDLDLRGTRLLLVSPGYAEHRLGRRFPALANEVRPLGVSIAVHSLKAAERVLTEAQVPFQPFGRGSILVQPDWAAGVYLELLGA